MIQKTKFQIKGMHCHSCASLIELKLKEHPGIIKIKVNKDSQKAVVVYDDQKIGESDIHRLVGEAGDYHVETMEKDEEEPQRGEEEPQRIVPPSDKTEVKPSRVSPKMAFFLGLLACIVVFSLLLNIVLGISFFKQPLSKAEQQINGSNSGQQLPSVPSDNTQQPLPDQQAPTIQSFDITKNNHVRGDFNAPITLVEFSDFECPFCERHYPTLNKILSDYKGKVRLVYKHFPLSFHPNAQKAAEASECADEQGKFWEYHDKLFDNQPNGYSTDKFKQWAKELSLDESKFNNCLDSGKYAQKVQADFQEGTTKGVNGTPATFVNGLLISGALPYESFKQAIDSLLTK